MSELRKDWLTGKCVIIASDRAQRPIQVSAQRKTSSSSKNCPFCAGNESLTPAESYAIRPKGGKADSVGWQVRVVPNKFPALALTGDEFKEEGSGQFKWSKGLGVHEVIIENPSHTQELTALSLDEVCLVLDVYKERLTALRKNPLIQYPLLFKNVGLAGGASLEHPHTQLVGLPMIPTRVKEKLKGLKEYKLSNGSCGFCDVINAEIKEKSRIVYSNDKFVAFCPFASRFPYEVCITPRGHETDLTQMDAPDTKEFAQILQGVLNKLKGVLGDESYNLMLHTAPKASTEWEVFHWHMEVLPRLTHLGGFEWGTDCLINIASPEDSARKLREAA